MTGTVKWFSNRKGYGFVTGEEDGQDYFVHYSEIESEKSFKTLHTGAKVEFGVREEGEKKFATHVREA